MITIDAPTVSLDAALQQFIKWSLDPNSHEYRMVLLVPTHDMAKYGWKRLHDVAFEVPHWLLLPIVQIQQHKMQFANGCSIKIISSPLQARGLSITHCGIYLHPDHPWKKDDMHTVIPAIRTPINQNFVWVTE